MFSVIVKNTSVELGDTSINFTFNNPLFDNSLFQKEYSYSFLLPATGVNNTIFSNSNRIDSSIRNQKFDCQIYIEGILFIEGVIIVTANQNNSYSCYVNSGGIDLERSIGIQQLNNLELDEIIVSSSSNPETIINNWQAHMNNVFSTWYEDLKYCFPQIRVAGQFTPIHRSESPYQNSNHAQTDVTADPYAFQKTFNKYDSANNTYFKPFASSNYKWTHSAIPFVMLKYLIKSIFSEYGITVRGGEFFNSENFAKLTVMQMKTLDNYFFEGGIPYNAYPNVFKIREYLPDLTVKDFLQGVADQFNIRFVIDGTTVTINTANEMLDTEEDNISEFFNEDYKYQWSDDGESYVVCYAEDEEEKGGINSYIVGTTANGARCSDTNVEFVHYEFGAPPNYVIQGSQFEGTNKLTLSCQPVFANGTADMRDTLITWRQCISIPYFGTPDNVNMLRLCNYIGAATIDNKPLATAYNYIFRENTTYTYFTDRVYVDAINLSMNDTNGIFATYYKDYLDIIKNSKKVSKVGTLGASEIKKLINWAAPSKRLYQENGYVRAYVKTVNFSVSNDGISDTKTDFLTI